MSKADMPSQDQLPSLGAIHDQLGALLEARVTELMSEIKASQALTRQIARTEEEIERQRLLKDKLEGELGPLRQQADQLHADVTALRDEVDGVADAVARLEEIQSELAALKDQAAEGA